MNYQNYYPASYQPVYSQYQQFQPQQMGQQIQQTVPQQNYPQIGFIRVQSENDARMYPVAPGNSVTFIDENAPYCYTKTVDASQLDRPKFEKYRLVKEEDTVQTQNTENLKSDIEYVTRDEFESLKQTVDKLLASKPGRKTRDESSV